MASNPVLRGFEKTGRPGQGSNAVVPPPPSTSQLNEWYAAPSYGQPPAAQAPSRYLTLDDVITRTVVLLATMLVAAGVAWFVVPNSAVTAVTLIGMLGAFGLGMFISITGRANAGTTITYAALEGLALGGISEWFNRQWPGIVVQAITGTIMVAGGVLVVYKTGAVRVTPKFTKIVFASTLGVVGLMLVNVIAGLFHPGGLGLRDPQTNFGIAVAFSLLCIVIAAANLIVDFDMIEQSVRRGTDERFGWYLSFGIMVTLVWLYLEILRLLSYLQGGGRNN
ncbi:MAG TPA: Bax inhibitor-1/YccA family protein [Jatrophihabitans sp.]|nr:Bax inhibitor-1/YccA family protein [Jatrophihabitans sp.]